MTAINTVIAYSKRFSAAAQQKQAFAAIKCIATHILVFFFLAHS